MMEKLLKLLKEERIQRKKTLADIGEALGISDAAVSKIELGKTVLTLERFIKICEVLGVEPDVVLKACKEEFSCKGENCVQRYNDLKRMEAQLRVLPERDFLLVKEMVTYLTLTQY